MAKAKHTLGPVGQYALSDRYNDGIRIAVDFDKPAIATLKFGHQGYYDAKTTQANADVIWEAFNVATETGLTPRQIAEQRMELLEACKTLAVDCRMALNGDWDKGDEGFEASLEMLESVIAKATGDAS